MVKKNEKNCKWYKNGYCTYYPGFSKCEGFDVKSCPVERFGLIEESYD